MSNLPTKRAGAVARSSLANDLRLRSSQMKPIGWILIPLAIVAFAIISVRGLGSLTGMVYGFYNAPFPWWVTIPAALVVVVGVLYLWEAAERRSKISPGNRR